MSDKKIVIVAATALAAFLCLVYPASGKPGLDGEQTRTLRNYTLSSGGESFRIQDLKNEVVVVAFWASWCKPCKREMPLLDELHTELSASGGRVVAISVDRDPARAEKFIEKNGLELPISVDGPDGVAREIELGYLPFTIVFDRSGKAVFSGVTTSEESWNGFRELLAGLVDTPTLAVQEE